MFEVRSSSAGVRAGRIRPAVELALVALGFAILTIVMTWPLSAHLGELLPGDGEDVWVHRWTFHWVKTALQTGQSPFYTHLLYYPQGVSLAYHNFAWLNIAAWLPLQALVGETAAYNLVFMAVIVFNGLATYLLAKELIGSRWAAWVAALIYAFWPYLLSEHSHPNMMFVGWVPLSLLLLKRTLDTGRLGYALCAAVSIALIGLARWHLLVMGSIVIVLFTAVYWLGNRRLRTWRNFWLLALIIVVAALLALPLALPMIRAQFTWSNPDDVFVPNKGGQADLLAYIVPPSTQLLGPLMPSNAYSKALVSFLGYATISLAIYGAIVRWKRVRFWLLVALIYFLLALGAVLKINGIDYPQVPMPYDLVSNLFLVRILRGPIRFNVFLGLPLALVAAWGVQSLVGRLRLPSHKALLVGLLSALILVDSATLPYPTSSLQTPDWYRQLANEPGDFAILDLPMEPRGVDKYFMIYQLLHGKSLVDGHVSRLPSEAYAFIDSVPLLKALSTDTLSESEPIDITGQLEQLASAGVRYIILHTDMATPEQLAAWRDWLTIDPIYEQDGLVVYRTSPELGEDYAITCDLDAPIGLVRVESSLDWTAPGQVLRVAAHWAAEEAPRDDLSVCIQLLDSAGQVAERSCQPVSPSLPTLQWGVGELVRADYQLPVKSALSSGTYTLALELADSDSGSDVGTMVALGTYDIKIPTPSHRLNACWGDSIVLRGFDLAEQEDALELTLWWQAQREMGTSYKVFVHLVNTATGEIAAQYDAVPCQWTRPTDEWQAWEIVKDRIALSLADVPEGTYDLLVGLYKESNGKRANVTALDGSPYPDSSVPLAVIRRAPGTDDLVVSTAGE